MVMHCQKRFAAQPRCRPGVSHGVPQDVSMKGVVLAGGTGSRMFPLTKITNKASASDLRQAHDLLPHPDRWWMRASGEILVVTGGRNSGDFLRLLANGKEFGLKHLDYTYQEGEGGIADALGLAEHFADGGPICVILGDNIIERSIRHMAEDFQRQKAGAKILLKEVPDAERFGVAELGDGTLWGSRKNPEAQVEFCGDRHLYVRRNGFRQGCASWCPRAVVNWRLPMSTMPTFARVR